MKARSSILLIAAAAAVLFPLAWSVQSSRSAAATAGAVRSWEQSDMWYTGQTRERSWIGYARSTDGVAWRRMSSRPVIAPGKPWEKHGRLRVADNGRYLGERYGKEPHIVWVLGGDANATAGAPGEQFAIYRAIAEGIGQGATGRKLQWNRKDAGRDEVLMTYHPDGNPACNSSHSIAVGSQQARPCETRLTCKRNRRFGGMPACTRSMSRASMTGPAALRVSRPNGGKCASSWNRRGIRRGRANTS